ncbi:hypothetical protein [Pseudomonas sp. ICMP 460]|uniref:hypothetical protein n=1 Tax=Pseudomonas sp. ICMP 460 TaxID=1718917 RepID=UPI000C076590|nr:hypothetical protein [Pseudomonas sp. ICMP 460]PHN29453.1 hypothetical protein AO240_20735 [Pseudomonas sp. ICMP 460]
MERKKFNLWRLLRNVIIGAVVAAVISAVLMETAPDVVSPSCGENAMFAFLFTALSAGMYGIFAVLGLADTVEVKRTAEKSSVVEGSMHIDDRVKMAANAKRYEWLRDRDRVTDIDTDLCVARDETVYFGHDLDKNVDDAIRLARLEGLHP